MPGHIGQITLALAFMAALPAAAQEPAVAAPPQGSVAIAASYSVNVPLASTEDEVVAASEAEWRKSLYARAAAECTDLLATIASECQVTAISLSSQANIYPGQPPSLYISVSVNATVALK